MYGVKTCTLARWRCKKVGPRYAKLGSRVMYDIEDLEDWFASRCVHTRDSAPQLRKR
ncbi:MAG TPA: DNA-binding protein [Candidatus Desulfovibrio gallistercoris]|nr:DNA-binding protein [Candidatus Desulfovibrio gallistercoris]